MRLLELDGRQVGHWQAPLALSLSPRLNVVLGDNEAGKSTLRRALRALLFGPDRKLVAPITPGSFEVMAKVVQGDSTESLHRRGLKLQGLVSESLTTLLQDSNAGRFASLFDLTHDNLRPGDSAAFLKAEGDFGSLMFAARTGLSPAQLENARQRIAETLRDLDSSARGRLGVPHFRGRYQEAKERYERLGRFEHNDQLHTQHQALDSRVDELDGELRRLEDELRRYDGLIGCAQQVEALALDRRALAQLQEAGALPSVTRVTQLGAGLDRVEELLRQVAEAQASLSAAEAALQAAEPPGLLHALLPQCEAMQAVVAGHVADNKTLQQLRSQYDEVRGELLDLLQRLGDPVQPDSEAAAEALLRPEPQCAQLRSLLQRHEDLQDALMQKQVELQAAIRGRDQVPAETACEDDIAMEALDAAIARLRQACDAEAELQRLRGEETSADAAMLHLQRTLGAAAELASPDGLSPPSPDAARDAEHALEAARQKLRAAGSLLAQHEEGLKALQRRLDERRQQIGGVASAEDVAAARSLRDAHLQALCAALRGDAAGAASPETVVARAEALQSLVRQSDLLIDSRLNAGEALGQLRAEEQQTLRLQAQVDDARLAADRAQQQCDACLDALKALWPFLREPPASASRWFEQMQDWREGWEAQQERAVNIAMQTDILSKARQDAVALVGAALPQLSSMATAQVMLDTVSRERQTRALKTERRATLNDQRAKTEEAVGRAQQALDQSDAALADWQQLWNAATQELPSSVANQPTGVETWLDLQDTLRKVLRDSRAVAKRMSDCAAELGEKKQRIEALLQQARETAPDLLPAGIESVAAFSLVERVCKTSAQRLAHHQKLSSDCESAKRSASVAAEKHALAESELAKDWSEVALGGERSREALQRLMQRAVQAETLRARISEAEAALRGRWDGEEAAAEAEIRSAGEMTLQARRDDVDAALHDVRAERDEAANRRRDIDRELQSMQQSTDATEAAQALADAREALLDIIDHRYRLSLVKLILDQALQRASDGGEALEQNASEYFRVLTGGAYEGLRIDRDNPAAPSLKARVTPRIEKGVDELSAGTCDQLWLALRLAGIVAAAEETPFPLLLDDSLVQFDDIRAAAALQLLHRISAQVQVILFTHHDHLAQLAEANVPAEDLAVVVLPEVSGAMRRRVGRAPSGRRARPSPGADASESTSIVETDDNDHDGSVADSPEPSHRRSLGDLEEDKAIILSVLQAAAAPLGKSDIMSAAANQGQEIVAWQAAINELLSERRIGKEGDRRGAKYHLMT